MERALNDLPRTRHRLLIYRFKVITKSRMGLDVQMDLQKFREESEKNLAQMYRKVAVSSLKHSDTIGSYQRAIETLCVRNLILFFIIFISFVNPIILFLITLSKVGRECLAEIRVHSRARRVVVLERVQSR